MQILKQKYLKKIISGANFLGTGGGGTIAEAMPILKEIKKPVQLVSLNKLNKNDFLCTVFGVGAKQSCDSVIASKEAFWEFQKVCNKSFSAIVPVEVGTISIATSMLISSNLKIPILDSDIVGMRSSPEVFLETITLANLKRTPCVVCDSKGNKLVIRKEKSPKEIEKQLRKFAVFCGGDAFVAGYPLKVSLLKNVLPDGSITLSKKIGNEILKLKDKKINLDTFCQTINWQLIDFGTIKRIKKDSLKGFVKGRYEIESEKNIWTVIFKNENLVLLKNNKVILTCPDSISLLNLELFEGINNFENNKKKKVAILVKKAIPIWRTEKGKKLFSPKNLGINYRQILLK